MLTRVCAAKGGQGCTTVTAALALVGAPAVAVDAGGDLPAVLGVPEPTGPGLVDLLVSDVPVSLDALGRLLVDVGAVGLVPIGAGRAGDVPAHRWEELAATLAGDRARWVLDAGTGPATRAIGSQTVLVVRNCFLALRRAVQWPLRPDRVVLVSEPHRALDGRDVAAVLGAVPVTTVRVDPAVARAVDAGLLAVRLPRSLRADLTATPA